MFTSPTRADPLLAAIVSPTVPFASPVCPDVIAIHDASVVAFQPHPVSVVTETNSVPPPEPIVSCERPSAYVHGAAAWLTDSVCDPTTIDPDRAAGLGFAATL